MKLCLGILAYNEERCIGKTLQGLLAQDLWNDSRFSGHIQVVVNGSSDQTVARAREALAEAPVPWEVHDLEQAGKANAWNELVHQLSPEDTDTFILADADIELPQEDALRRLVEVLVDHPEAVAAVDEPLKDLTREEHASAADRLSVAASALASAGPPKLCGQLYAARAASMRKIFLPEPMLVEDGFIKAMLITDAFAQEQDHQRLQRAEGVFHYYEAERDPRRLYHHEKRILLGSLSNFLLFDLAKERVAAGEAPGAWMRQQTKEHPEWFRELIREKLGPGAKNRKLFAMVGLPFRQLKHLSGSTKLKALPAAMIRSMLNLSVALGAARDLKSGTLEW